MVSLQNGLGNLEILSGYFDKNKLIAAVTSEASFLISDGNIRYTATGLIKVAPVTKSSFPIAREFSELLQLAGLKSITKNDAQDILWGKLVANSAINPLSAITGLSNGHLLSSVNLRKLISKIATETYTVGRIGANVNPDIEGESEASSYVLKTAATTAQNKSSMLQDLFRGKKTEVDFINGVVCRIAKKVSFDAPLNETMYSLVKTLEENRISKSQRRTFQGFR